MKLFTLPVILVALCAIFCAGTVQQASAAETETISVTVSLESAISISLDTNTWNIGPVQLSSTSAPSAFTATNNGNVAERLTISATNGANNWNIGTQGANTFQVNVADPAISLSTTSQELAANVGVGLTKAFSLTYKAPTSDGQGGGKAHGFTITVTASAAP